jgi:gliding motility-associated-like protein
VVTSEIQQNIVLKAWPVGDSSIVRLQWNQNPVWNNKRVRYEIYRKLDGALSFTKIGATFDVHMEFNNLKDGFDHRFFVEAVNENDGIESMSNVTGFNYHHPIFIPNVITPNGDGHNDYFVIENVEIFFENELWIYNRYGKLVLDLKNFRNNWNGGDLPSGTYYYLFKTIQYNQIFNGWIEIIR